MQIDNYLPAYHFHEFIPVTEILCRPIFTTAGHVYTIEQLTNMGLLSRGEEVVYRIFLPAYLQFLGIQTKPNLFLFIRRQINVEKGTLARVVCCTEKIVT